MDKRIFSVSIILIAVISLLSPAIISNLMLQQGTIMDIHYYIQYMANLSGVYLSLFFLASLAFVLFLKKNR
ncbi:hypothetical protein [Lysinibacillus fusiformis]|uniref:hypothetical protein n=1 Tax=Lysinibacillus fusiformis TaxID=28031 RepID=UPI0030180DB6